MTQEGDNDLLSPGFYTLSGMGGFLSQDRVPRGQDDGNAAIVEILSKYDSKEDKHSKDARVRRRVTLELDTHKRGYNPKGGIAGVRKGSHCPGCW